MTFKPGDKVKYRAGNHIYTIIEIKKTDCGDQIARIDELYPDFWCNLNDLVPMQEDKHKDAV